MTTVETQFFCSKEPGCEPGEKVERDYAYEIPLKWKEFPNQKDCKETNFLGNWLGEVFAIGYTLGFYVKFMGWNEFGAGDRLVIPIRIFNEPRLVEAEEGWRVPENWEPIYDGFEPTQIWHQ